MLRAGDKVKLKTYTSTGILHMYTTYTIDKVINYSAIVELVTLVEQPCSYWLSDAFVLIDIENLTFHEGCSSYLFKDDKFRPECVSLCDCGGFKTFKTMSSEAHSSWCISNKGKVSV